MTDATEREKVARPVMDLPPFKELTTFPAAPPGRDNYTRNSPVISMESKVATEHGGVYDALADGPQTLDEVVKTTGLSRTKASNCLSHLANRWGKVAKLRDGTFKQITDTDERKRLKTQHGKEAKRRKAEGTITGRVRECIRVLMLEGLTVKNALIHERTDISMRQIQDATKELRKRVMISTSPDHEHRLTPHNLSGKERVLIALRHRGQMSMPDIARSLSIPPDDAPMIVQPALEQGVIDFNPQLGTYSLPKEKSEVPNPYTNELQRYQERNTKEKAVTRSPGEEETAKPEVLSPATLAVENQKRGTTEPAPEDLPDTFQLDPNIRDALVHLVETIEARWAPMAIDDLEKKLRMLNRSISVSELFGEQESVALLTSIKTDLLKIGGDESHNQGKLEEMNYGGTSE